MKKLTYGMVLISLLLFSGANPKPEVDKVVIDIQQGTNYMGMIVMKEMFWAEEAKKNGLTTELELNVVNGASAVADRFLSGANQGATMGYTLILELYDKTNGDVKILFPNSTQVARLNVNKADIKSLKDFKEGDKIAVPSIGTGTHGLATHIFADKLFGNYKALDKYLTQMSHPDAYTALMVGKVTAHWATLPFSLMELENKDVRTIATAEEAFGVYNLTGLGLSVKFANDNPKIVKALFDANKKAVEWINADFKRAAQYFKDKQPKAKESVEDYMKQLQTKEIVFGVEPKGILMFAKYLYKFGNIKKEIKDWKQLTFSQLHSMNGN